MILRFGCVTVSAVSGEGPDRQSLWVASLVKGRRKPLVVCRTRTGQVQDDDQ